MHSVSHHLFLSDPCPLLAGPRTGTGAGGHGISPPFPPGPPLQAPKGAAPLRTPLIRQSCRQLTEYRNIYSDIPLIPLLAAEAAPAAAPCSGGPRKPRAAASLHDPQPLAASSTMRPAEPAPRSLRSLVCAYAGEASDRRSLPSLLLGLHHVAPSASCIFAPSLRVARAAENLPLRGSSSPSGFRFPPCAPSVRVRRARRKAPDGARTYREGERSWKNFTQRQRR